MCNYKTCRFKHCLSEPRCRLVVCLMSVNNVYSSPADPAVVDPDPENSDPGPLKV